MAWVMASSFGQEGFLRQKSCDKERVHSAFSLQPSLEPSQGGSPVFFRKGLNGINKIEHSKFSCFGLASLLRNHCTF